MKLLILRGGSYGHYHTAFDMRSAQRLSVFTVHNIFGSFRLVLGV